MSMPEEIKTITEALKSEAIKSKPSPRELILENALKNGIIVVENLALIVQRMGMRSKGSEEWLDEARQAINGK